jgi:hypothetical protein
MIVKRILRLALGPSFLDPFPPDSEVQQAAQTNREIEGRVLSAETNILNYIGLGMTRKRRIDRAGQRNFQNGTADSANHTGFDLDMMNGFLPGNADEIANNMVNNNTEEVGIVDVVDARENDEYRSYEEEYIETMLYTVSVAALGLNAALHWPVSTIRCRVQVFGNNRSPVRFGYSLYAAVAASVSKDLIKEGVNTAAKKANGSLVAKHKGLQYAFEAGEFIVTWLVTYPLLETVVAYTLDLEPVPLREMFSVAYYRENAGLILEFGLWQLAEELIHLAWTNILRTAIGPTRKLPIPNFPSIFFLTTCSQLLGELSCIPISTRIYRKIAMKYMVLPTRALDLDALMRAVGLEWIVTWGIGQVHGWAVRKLSATT